MLFSGIYVFLLLFSRPRDNHAVTQMIASNVQSVSTTVVQLYVAERGGGRQWKYVLTGVAILAKDSNRRSYFIQVFDMDQRRLSWEQEIYREFQFKMPKSDVAIFEADNAVCSLLFADATEAKHFQSAVQLRLSKLTKNLSVQPRVQPANMAMPQPTVVHNVSLGTTNSEKKSPKMSRNPLKKKNKKSKPKLTLDDIGAPTNFVHIMGTKLKAGGEMQTVNNMTEIEPGMRQIFEMVRQRFCISTPFSLQFPIFSGFSQKSTKKLQKKSR